MPTRKTAKAVAPKAEPVVVAYPSATPKAAFVPVPLGHYVAAKAVAPKAPKVCTKTDPWVDRDGVTHTGEHGPKRVTRSGNYCYPCDRILLARQQAERAASKAAAAK